jgi:hypothetical protein
MADLMTAVVLIYRDLRFGSVIIDSRSVTQRSEGLCSFAITGVGRDIVIACKQAPSPTAAFLPLSTRNLLSSFQATIGRSQVIEARLSSSKLPAS